MSNDQPPVVKLAQKGYDVKTAGDENLIYNSNWPMPKIYKQGSFTIPNTALSETIVIDTHDLNFVPFFWYFANTPITAWDNSGNVGTEKRSEFMGPIGDGALSVTSDKIKYVPSSFPLTTGSSKLYYYIFALDLTVQYTAPIIKVGSVATGGDEDYVFKLAKEGKSITSNDLDDYIVHSRARSPLIHSVNPSKGVVKNFVVNHNLGYLPMFFPFVKTSAGYKPLYTGQGGSSSILSDENTVTFNDSGGQEVSIVILKDPFLIDYSVRVNI